MAFRKSFLSWSHLPSLLLFLLGLNFYSFAALAYYSPDRPIHHQFNARLLKKGEKEITVNLPSILPWGGHFRIGLTSELEVGTNASLLLNKFPNFNLKHQMFKFDQVETSFITYPVFGRQYGIDFLFAPTGVVSTVSTFDSTLLINLGLFDAFVRFDNSGQDAIFKLHSEIHIVAPLVGADLLLSNHLSLTSFVFLPTFASLELLSDIAELSAQLHLYRGEKLGFTYPAFYYFGLSYGWQVFSLDFGLGGVDKYNMMMTNLVWRFS